MQTEINSIQSDPCHKTGKFPPADWERCQDGHPLVNR